MTGRLADGTAIITGAGAGFGEGIAKRFAEEGARIVIADINGREADRVAGEIGAQAAACHADVTDTRDIDRMVAMAEERFGGLDILVNNAGYTYRNQPLDDVEEEAFDRIYAVNMKAIYLAARAALPHFSAAGGVIINTASTAGLRPRPGLTWYNASKGWVITATKSMAVELAPRGIRVNCLCPVAGETGMLELFMGADTPELREKFIATVPLGRLSRPRDIADAALFLASEEASFITGAALEVDGGRCI